MINLGMPRELMFQKRFLVVRFPQIYYQKKSNLYQILSQNIAKNYIVPAGKGNMKEYEDGPFYDNNDLTMIEERNGDTHV